MVFNSVINNKQGQSFLCLHRDLEIIILPFILLRFVRKDIEDKWNSDKANNRSSMECDFFFFFPCQTRAFLHPCAFRLTVL